MRFARTLAGIVLLATATAGIMGCTQQEKKSVPNTNLENSVKAKQTQPKEPLQVRALKETLFDKSGNPDPRASGNAIDLEHVYLFRDNNTASRQEEVTLLTDYFVKIGWPVNAERVALKIENEHERAKIAMELIPENSRRARILGATVNNLDERYKILKELMDSGHAKDALYLFQSDPNKFSGLDDTKRLSISEYFLKSGNDYVWAARKNAENLRDNNNKVKFAKTLVNSGNPRNAVYLTETIKIGPNDKNRNFVVDVMNYIIDAGIASKSADYRADLRTDATILRKYIDNPSIVPRN